MYINLINIIYETDYKLIMHRNNSLGKGHLNDETCVWKPLKVEVGWVYMIRHTLQGGVKVTSKSFSLRISWYCVRIHFFSFKMKCFITILIISLIFALSYLYVLHKYSLLFGCNFETKLCVQNYIQKNSEVGLSCQSYIPTFSLHY